MTQNGVQEIKLFTWDKVAEQTLAQYRRIVHSMHQ